MRHRPSISTRLFGWLFLAGLMALCLGGVGLYLEVRTIIYDSLDHNLQSDLEIFAGLLHYEDGDIEFEYDEAVTGFYSIPRSGHYYQVFLGGELLTDSISLVGETLDLAPERLVSEDSGRRQRIYDGFGPADELLRIIEFRLAFNDQPARIVVAHTQVDSLEILNRFRHFLFLSGALGTLFVALIGWWLSRWTLKPLHTFSATINQVGEKNLDQRINAEKEYREFGILAQAFNNMLDRLQRSLRMREELLSDVSHELKTPVAVIRSHCDIYLQQNRPAEEYVEALETIREAADSMGGKIHRLLSIAQSEAELLNLSGFPTLALDACLRRAWLTVEPLARNKEIVYQEELAEDLTVAAHEERLLEAFSCLLENAVKYNRQAGFVRIVAERLGDWAIIHIEDNGCGIAPQDMEKIFERFYRGSRTADAEGTGLGLVLAKTIFEAHGGEIQVETLKEGSCFTVRLPLVR